MGFFFFCLLGFSGKKESEDSLLQEPLLNGTSTSTNGAELNKSSGGEIVAPFSYASLLSILAFSWMGPPIGAGYKKALDLNNVPQLAGVDSVKGAFPVFRSKLENRAFENQGCVMVSAFSFAKLIECLAQRHWIFRMRQAEIRARAVLVAMIYNKGLTISCQSKQGHTSGEIVNLMSGDAWRVSDFGWYIHDPWLVIVQVILALVILYKNLGLVSDNCWASTDQSAVDFPIPNTIAGFAFSIMQLLGTVMIMSQQYYIRSARELARLAGVCEAPFIQYFAESMSGSTTIRSFNQESRFKELSTKLIDGHSRTNFYTAGIAGLAVMYGLSLNTLQKIRDQMVTGQLVEKLLSKICRLSIIPQDPTMFQGTVRSNLDPLEEYTDELIWEALDKCQLGDEVRKKEGKLDSAVTENGENWSMDQRQLVCLGRVVLKKSKVLVLDQATASVDTATDNLIQLTLKQHFSDCTVLTVAHRITTVVDSDMVLLLDHVLIEEHDSPTKLLENKSSSFSKLVAECSTRSSSSPQK
ncbi:hypothetical protein RHSIM_Rhsim09G0009800 [Rhododendron simsii]|uniref:Uncharacterized protein n=1 Tax=Rhododendron simsii TaxID=118357 RepID=A0A834GGA2_RHOSS|nr:hypothetical protein RHSIM_Rhsim09G0009800 [Rhododendron simsii]